MSNFTSFCSHLLPDDKKKFKTRVFRNSTNPEWNERFVFERLKVEDLHSNIVLEVTVWDLPKNTKNYEFIGGLRLGPRPHQEKQLRYMDSCDTELAHWMSIVNTPGNCVEQSHTLRHTMDPRQVTLAADEPKKVTNQTTVSEEVISDDIFAIGEANTVTMTTNSSVTSQEVIGSHDPLPQHESTPVTATMVTQPDISIITEDTLGKAKTGFHGNGHSPVRTERIKFDDNDDDHSNVSTPQVIIMSHPH